MPTARQAAAAVVLAGKLRVLGGSDVNGVVATHEVYDPAAGWTTDTPMSTKLSLPIVTTDGQRILAGSGSSSSGPNNGFQAYTPPSPTIAVTPASVDFGSVAVGATSDKTFTVQNTGSGTLSGAATVSSPFSVVSGTPYALTAGQSQTVTVRFSPAQTGPFNGTVAFTGAAGSTASVTGTAVVSQTGTWAPLPSLPAVQTPAGGGVVNNKLYGFSGGNPNSQTPTYGYALDLANTAAGWSSAGLQPPPFQGSASAQVAIIGNKLYFVSVTYDCTKPADSVYIYDTAVNLWSSTPFPAPRCSAAVAALDGKLYVVGGWLNNSVGAFTRVDIYDPVANKWASGTDFPHVIEGAAAAAMGGKLYVAGGWIRKPVAPFGAVTNEFWSYDGNVWTQLQSMPTARQAAAAVVLAGKLHVLGGSGVNGVVATHELYDPSSGWTTDTPMSRSLSTPIVTTDGQRIFVGSGGSNSGANNTFEVYTPPSFSPPTIAITPASIDFGSVPAGTTLDRAFTVRNIGGGTLLGGASISNGRYCIPENPDPCRLVFSVQSPSTYTLGPGQSQTVTIRYSPFRSVPDSATVTFTGGAGATAQVTGTAAVGPIIQVAPSGLDFGAVLLQSVFDLPITITNAGVGTLSGTASVGVPFSIISGGAYSLTAGQTQVITVRFSPAAAGNFTDMVTLTGGGGATVGVKGIGTLKPPTMPFAIVDRGAVSAITDGGGNAITLGYATIVPNAGSTTPTGVAIFGYSVTATVVTEFGPRTTHVLVTEAGVPSSPLIRSGRIYAEVSGPVNTGLAIANPNSQPATISFSFTDSSGADFGTGVATIPANGQIAHFLDEAPFNGVRDIHGTFSFSSTAPVSVIALRGLTNERQEFLISTLPVADTSAPTGTSNVVLPHFADGAGWTTQVILANPSDSTITGNLQFVGTTGQPATLTANGQTGNTFPFSIPRRSSFKLITFGTGMSVQTGSVQVLPASGSIAPTSVAIFSFRQNDVTVSEAAVPAVSGTGLRMYVEASGVPKATGSIQSGIAVANLSSNSASVTFELTTLDGVSLASTSQTLPANGQVARFLNEIFASLVLPVRGVLRITTTGSGVSVVGLRGRYNERGDFLITTTPARNEGVASTADPMVFPHLVNGGGYSTQFILFSGSAGQSASGKLQFFNQDGTPLGLNLSSRQN